jgi:hypothetical protein
MPLTDEQIAALSPNAASHYEANAFAELHSESFVPCRYNSDVMMAYLAAHKLPLTVANFERAFKALTLQFKLWPSPAVMASMSSGQIKKLQEEIGIPRFDLRGKITGFDWPDGITNLIAATERAWVQQRTVSDLRPTNPKLVGHKPTAKEIATWSSAQFREWQNANEV